MQTAISAPPRDLPRSGTSATAALPSSVELVDHARLRNKRPPGSDLMHPGATRRMRLYSAVAKTPIVPETSRGTRKLSPSLSPCRCTAERNIAISRDKMGERRDSNPRSPGPQPGGHRPRLDREHRRVRSRSAGVCGPCAVRLETGPKGLPAAAPISGPESPQERGMLLPPEASGVLVRTPGPESGRQDLNLRPPGPQPERSRRVRCSSAS